MSRYLFSIGIFAIWLYCRQDINSWQPNLQFLGNLLGTCLPLYFLVEPASHLLKKFLRIKLLEFPQRRFINAKIENLFRANEQKQPNTKQQKSILTSDQIKALNSLRSKVNAEEVLQFPLIRVSGSNMPNLVPEAGIFTAKIKRHGEIQNLVVMLSTQAAVQNFEKLYFIHDAKPFDFWAQGHLLPSSADICYSVLYVTSFRLNGNSINF
jgi:hypothetical protein